MQSVKSRIRYHCHVKFQRIKHQVRTLFMQRCIIDIGNKTCYLIGLTSHLDRIANLDADVVRVHTVDRDLILRFRETSIHQTCLIDLICSGKNTDGSVSSSIIIIIFLFVSEEIFIQADRSHYKIRII